MNRRRVAALITVAAAVTVGLTGCQTKVGAAAIVGDQRISERSITDYTVAGDASGQTKAIALTALIQSTLFERTLQRNGGVPSDGDLAQYHDRVFSELLNQQVSGAAADQALRQAAQRSGLDTRFDSVYLRSLELELALATKLDATDFSVLQKAVATLGVKITVNPRYGAWDATNLAIGETPTPSFLTLPSPSPSSSSAPAAS